MLGTKEIGDILGVKAVTVRKYATALENAGYIVTRGDGNHREYSEDDATAFRQLQALCKRSGMTVETAAEVVASRHKRAHESISPAVITPDSKVMEQYEERYKEALEIIKQLNDHNREQSDQMERLTKRMDEQSANISLVLREVLETRRLVAASSGRKWWKFWEKEQPTGPDPETNWNRKQNPEDYL
jgi:DNA-binding transcriptional MerR regulator